MEANFSERALLEAGCGSKCGLHSVPATLPRNTLVGAAISSPWGKHCQQKKNILGNKKNRPHDRAGFPVIELFLLGFPFLP
jgi:hypothetical protein